MKTILSFAVAGVGFLSAFANGDTWYVSADLGDDSNDGTTMATAFKTLETVFGTNMDGHKDTSAGTRGRGWHDTVILSNGTYYLSKPIKCTSTNLKGWTGDPKDVILDGQNTSAILYHIYYYPRYATTTSGITFQNGAYQTYGSFIVAPVASLDGNYDTFTNCVFRDMQYLPTPSATGASLLGGALCLNKGGRATDCRFVNCRVASNKEADNRVYGGAIGTYQAGPVIENCWFSNCCTYVKSGGARYGGAIASYWEAEGCTVTNCTIYDCAADGGRGGAIYMRKHSRIYDTKIYNCSACRGGGIEAVTNAVIDGCIISNCYSTLHGGGIYDEEKTVRIRNCQVLDSYVKFSDEGNHYGGGIYVPSGDIEITNTVVTGGKARHGGGIYTCGGTPITDCVVSNCEVTLAGGGIYLTGANATIRRCTVVGNRTTGSSVVTYGGGGIFAGPSTLICDSTVSDNSSVSLGGGIRGQYYTTISNVVAVGNRAPYGGGFCVMATNLVWGCTVSNNVATYNGGGIWGCEDYEAGSYRTKAVGVQILNTAVSSNLVTGTSENWERRGGGICVRSGYLTVTNCLVANNAAESGAGLAVGSGTKLLATSITNNVSYYGGAGLHAGGTSDVTIENCLFETNCATGYKAGYGYDGGAIYFGASGNIRLAETVFLNNASAMGGGAVKIQYGSGLLVTNCVFSGNHANMSSGCGSALAMEGRRNDEFVDLIVENNRAWRGTFIMSHYGSTYHGVGFRMRNCLFRNNYLSEQGHVYTQYANVTNYYDRCTFAGNTGGAVFRWHGYVDAAAQSNQWINACVLAGNATDFQTIPGVGVNIRNTYGWNLGKAKYPYAETFRDAASGDYRPVKGSVLVDYACTDWPEFGSSDWASVPGRRDLGDGTWQAEPVADYGVRVIHNRPQRRLSGGTPDLGCFEYRHPKGAAFYVR